MSGRGEGGGVQSARGEGAVRCPSCQTRRAGRGGNSPRGIDYYPEVPAQHHEQTVLLGVGRVPPGGCQRRRTDRPAPTPGSARRDRSSYSDPRRAYLSRGGPVGGPPRDLTFCVILAEHGIQPHVAVTIIAFEKN